MENEILKIGEDLLKVIALPVVNFDENLLLLVNKMYSLMQKYYGVGLAAPQIGISQRILVYGTTSNVGYPNTPDIPCNVLINPVILQYSNKQEELLEGCLSVPNIRGPVNRSISIAGYAQDLTGKIIIFEEQGFLARIIQHEIDHLNGISFLQRIHDFSKVVFAQAHNP